MRLFGFDIARTKATSPVDDRRDWFTIIREGFAGAWQQNVEVKVESVLAFHAVFACMTLIASDIAKLRVKLVVQDKARIWSETANAAYSPVLRKPNGYQTRIQFWESYILSKLSRGNTYVLKQRDARGVVIKLYVLDPCRVKPLVSDDGEVFYELRADNLANVSDVVVPAREVIHDRFNCLFHPLVGLSPIYACGLAATQGLKIQNNSAAFFANGSRPGGVLTAPGRITQDTADRLKADWQEKYSGANAGKVAVLGDGLKYEAMGVSPDDALVVDQLKLTAEIVCSTFHVPPYKLGLGSLPANSNVQSLNVEYYSQCLQSLIEAAELCLDEGLGLGEEFKLGTEFDIDNLLRMDSATQVDVVQKAKGILTLDEQRRRLDAGPVEGGATIYLQQQDHSLAAIAARDAQLIGQVANPAPPPAPDAANDNPEEQARRERADLALFEIAVRRALNARR